MGLQKIVIIGFGGFAREVHWLLREINSTQTEDSYKILGHVISDIKPETKIENGLLGDFNWLEKNRDQWDSLALGIGTPQTRAVLAKKIEESFGSVEWPTLIHPSVNLDYDSCEMARGVLLCANVIGTVNLKIQEFAMVNLACTLGHEAQIGPACVLNPSVNISGGVTIGRETLIGTGAQILQNLQIGENVSIGAGAVVTKNIDAGITVVGMPAKPMNAK